MKSADQYRREGLADAAVLLVAGKVVPTMTLEDWARPLGLTQAEVRDAVARWKAEQYARAGVKAPAPTRAGHLQVLDGRSRDGDTKRRLREVATIYRADRAEGGTGTRAVADRLGVGAGQAAALVTRARRLGYITEQPADAGDYPCPEDGCSHIAHTKRGAATHARTHIPMTCPKCGRATNAAGWQAEALGVSRRQVHRWRAGAARLPATTADELAVRAGHHPFELWPDTWGGS